MDQMIAINKIYNEDCLDGMQEIDDKSIDLICTDLPYGQTARNKWDSVIPFEPLWEQYERIIKDKTCSHISSPYYFCIFLFISSYLYFL